MYSPGGGRVQYIYRLLAWILMVPARVPNSDLEFLCLLDPDPHLDISKGDSGVGGVFLQKSTNFLVFVSR